MPVFLIIIFVVSLIIAFIVSKGGGGNKSGKQSNERTTDQIWPFWGLDHGCIALKDGGAAIILRFSAFDFPTADEELVDRFNDRLSEAMRVVSLLPSSNRSGTGSGSTVDIAFCYNSDKLDMDSLLVTIGQAESLSKTQEKGRGIAGLAFDDARYLENEATKNGLPFWGRDFVVVISIKSEVLRDQLAQATNQEDSERIYQDYIERLAVELTATSSDSSDNYYGDDDDLDSDDDLPATNRGRTWQVIFSRLTRTLRTRLPFLFGAGTGGGGGGSSKYLSNAGFTRRFRAKSIQDTIKANIKEGWEVMRGDTNSRKLDVDSGGGIIAHPIPAILVELLTGRAEILGSALRPFSMDYQILNTSQAARFIAKAAGLPTRPVALSLAEIKFATQQVRLAIEMLNTPDLDPAIAPATDTYNGKDKGSGGGGDGDRDRDKKHWTLPDLTVAINRSLASQGWSVTANNKLAVPEAAYTQQFMPRDGNPNGQLDVAAAFGSVPIVFAPTFTVVGVPPEIEQAQAELVGLIKRFRRIQHKPVVFSQYLADTLKYGGYDPHWPHPVYMTTLVSVGWETSEIQMGQLIGLIARSGLRLNYNWQIKTPSPTKLKRQIQKLRYRRSMVRDFIKDEQASYEHAFEEEATERFLAQMAQGSGTSQFHLAGLRLTLMADSYAGLSGQKAQIRALLQSVGMVCFETVYDQAFGLYSSLPLGRDFIGDAAFTGKRTLRNMHTMTAAAFFPALIPDMAGGITKGSVLQGQSDTGGLILEDLSKLIVDHGVTIGMSGIGKSVNKFAMMGRHLYTYPNLFIRLLDPQNISSRVAQEWGGVVAPLDASGDVRFNFLDRFSLGGQPQVLSDVADLFITTIVQMIDRSLNDREVTAIKNMLHLTYLHMEQGVPITHYVVKGMVNRFGEEMGFADSNDPHQLQQTWFYQLEALYDYIRSAHNYPRNGFVVQVRFNPETGYPVAGQYLVRRPDGSLTKSDLGVVLEVLNTQPGMGNLAPFGRNYYAGQGYQLLEIPVSIYEALLDRMDERNLVGMEREAWLAFALTAYLAGPYPRRVSMVEEQLQSQSTSLPPPTMQSLPSVGGSSVLSVEQLISGETLHQLTDQTSPTTAMVSTATAKHQAQVSWLFPHEDPELRAAEGLPGTHLLLGSGPVWYEEEGWYAGVVADFNQQLSQTGLTANLDYLTRQRVERDVLMPLRYGTPILQDFIPLIASELYGEAISSNLEPYCHFDMTGRMFNGHTNTFTSSRFYAFQTKSLTGRMQGLRMMQGLEIIWREIAANKRGSGKKYWVILDEFGIISTQSPEVATYTALLYKRARALNTRLDVMEQNIETFQTKAGKYILGNTGVLQLMRQWPEAIEYWAEMYPGVITDEDKDRLATAAKGEALILKMEDGRIAKQWIHYGMHENTLKVLSTKPSDVQRYQEELKSYHQPGALELMLSDVLPLSDMAEAA